MFVGLGSDAHLRDDGGGGGNEGGEQVNSGGFAIGAALDGLAVEGDVLPTAVFNLAANPAVQRRFKGGDVQIAEDLRQGRFRGGLAATEAKGMSKGRPTVPAELRNGLEALATAEHGDNSQRKDGWQGMA